MSETTKKSARNPAIELYRVILMFLIVLHHAAYHAHWNHVQGLDAAWPSIYWIFTALTIWHVDGFISITGWFGTRFSLSRFAKLWGVIAFYSVLSVAYGWWSHGRLSSTYLAGGWFGQTYLYFLFMVPILNAAIEMLSKGGGKYMYLSWLIFDAAIVLNWAPYHLLTGVAGTGTDACSIMTLVAVYMNTRLLKVSGIANRFSLKIFCLCAFLFLLGVCASMVCPIGSTYNSPLVILMAISSLLFFEKFVRVPAVVSKMITIVSPCMFGVYLLHETTSFGHRLFLIPQVIMVESLSWHPLLIIFCSAVICFIACVCLDMLRRMCVAPACKCMLRRIETIDKKLGLIW